ncbi:MAG TPA: TonB-dependent receptor [Cryomorphaceae bacterium]|nr:TonB-dependent receptor [Owenweeksia sp.]HBF20823.1 TonB-dependent receptor [Cryomorphaceae bacterium]|tara:strand:+ start:20818 stop:23199 length:2382 start_codon:yes stop_codon:yes gene_type:complete
MKIKLFIISFLFGALGYAQTAITQNIRGRVIDQQSETPLPGVNVLVLEEGTSKGAVSDVDGYYVIQGVPVGRVSLGFSFMGYEPVTVQNVELLSSKELVINVSMRENTEQLDEVVVTADQQKERVKNERVTVSGRTFSIEESQRFAGALQDVSRMASNFAGVQRSNDSQNDIVIRGNSPIGLIWRMEGIDIPNPNHFGGLGATGGPVSMLNNNVLANSDFLTGAFPSEYGDGVSGVFDLQMRNGNYDKHEFLGQIGFNGLEAGAEGPINREAKSSYLINYRYSTLGVMSAMGIDFGTGTAVPYYQDLSMKLHFPSSKKGTIDVFALGGISSIDFLDSESEESDGGFYSDDQDLRNRVRTGVLGASHQYFYNKDLYSKVTVAATTIGNFTSVDTISSDGKLITPVYRQEFVQNDIQLSALVNKKFNARNVVRVGSFVTFKNYNLLDSTYDSDLNAFRDLRNHQENDMLYQPYVNWQHRFNEKWEANLGVHSMFLQSNSNYSIEPRFGLTYRLREGQSLNFGYGLHSQIAPVVILYEQIRLPDGSYIQPNEDLDFTKSHHFVLGYDRMFANRIHFKAETYYQYVYDAVIEQHPGSFSSLNAGGFNFGAPDSVKNGGRGYNYGLDLTLEKFLDKGFYFLTTLSLYESQYRGSDGIWRNTAFNGNYVYNLLGGKEFVLGKSKTERRKRKTITVDAKLTYAGGQRYTPLDLPASIAKDEEVYDESRAFGEQYDPYFRTDIRIGYKLSGKKVTQEWALDVQNVTNHQNPFGQDYDAEAQEAITTYQLGLFPMVLYRITF